MNLVSSVDIPNNWDEFVGLKSILPFCIAGVARLPEDLQFYKIYMESISKETRLDILQKLIGNNDVCLLKNNFPYTRLLQNLPTVKQYCLWSKKGKLLDQEVESIIHQNFPSQSYFWFENSEAVKSVPEIWHCHVFVKPN